MFSTCATTMAKRIGGNESSRSWQEKRSRLAILFILIIAISLYADLSNNTLSTYVSHEDGSSNVMISLLRRHNSRQPSINNNDDVISFEGSSNLLTLLRIAHEHKISNPLPHCINKHNNQSSLKSDNNIQIKPYNRAIEIDFLGRDTVPSVLPTWSHANTSSCYFTALSFPPTNFTLQTALKSTTYMTNSFHTISQCLGNAFNWRNETQFTCMGNNWGGTLGGRSREECIEESVGGYFVKQWLHYNTNNVDGKAMACFKSFIQNNDTALSGGYQYDIQMMESSALKLNVTATTLFNDTDKYDGLSSLMFGYGDDDDVDNWNTITFKAWSKAMLLRGNIMNSTTGDVKDVNEVMRQLDDILKKTKKDDENTATTASKIHPLIQCVDGLVPPSNDITTNHTKMGLYMTKSTMSKSPSSLLRSFPASLGKVLPPPPTAVYAVNAILAESIVNVPTEFYFPACTPYWAAVSNEKNAIKPFVEDEKNYTLFMNLTGTPRLLRDALLHSCSSEAATNDVATSHHHDEKSYSSSKCPYPTYDIVIDVSQVYCNGFFHFSNEVWPRIAPFLDSLLSDDMPPFAIRIGCSSIRDFHLGFYDLMGLSNSKGTILGDETVFAKEVIVPTEGYSHSPLLNYWSILATRRHVERHLLGYDATGATNLITDSSGGGNKKTVMVIVRDASRRGDSNIYDENFLEQLSIGLGSEYNVTAFKSSDDAMMKCLQCQVKAFMKADVVIGSHGAGLSHAMFAKKGGVVLERIVSETDSGIYAELAFINEMKYFAMESKATPVAYLDIIQFAFS